jgi:hypothetical protein
MLNLTPRRHRKRIFSLPLHDLALLIRCLNNTVALTLKDMINETEGFLRRCRGSANGDFFCLCVEGAREAGAVALAVVEDFMWTRLRGEGGEGDRPGELPVAVFDESGVR